MNFGEKFPYALPTSYQKLIARHTSPTDCPVYTPHTPPKTDCPACSKADCPTYVKHSSTPYTKHPSTPHPIPTATHLIPTTPNTYPSHTPTIHYPTTPPIPLLLRVDSDEMRQNRQVFGS